MEATITKLRVARSVRPATKIKTRGWQRKLRRQQFAAMGIGTVACTLTALSLSHLAHGIELATSASGWEGWAMASGIDLGFIGLEFAQITANTEALRRSIARFTKPAIAGTLGGSAAMNAFAFAEHASGPCLTAAAVVMGIAIPAMIYALMRVGTALYVDCQTRS
jgi:hypothetical protein